jgi:hypothetical protein
MHAIGVPGGRQIRQRAGCRLAVTFVVLLAPVEALRSCTLSRPSDTDKPDAHRLRPVRIGTDARFGGPRLAPWAGPFDPEPFHP